MVMALLKYLVAVSIVVRHVIAGYGGRGVPPRTFDGSFGPAVDIPVGPVAGSGSWEYLKRIEPRPRPVLTPDYGLSPGWNPYVKSDHRGFLTENKPFVGGEETGLEISPEEIPISGVEREPEISPEEEPITGGEKEPEISPEEKPISGGEIEPEIAPDEKAIDEDNGPEIGDVEKAMGSGGIDPGIIPGENPFRGGGEVPVIEPFGPSSKPIGGGIYRVIISSVRPVGGSYGGGFAQPVGTSFGGIRPIGGGTYFGGSGLRPIYIIRPVVGGYSGGSGLRPVYIIRPSLGGAYSGGAGLRPFGGFRHIGKTTYIGGNGLGPIYVTRPVGGGGYSGGTGVGPIYGTWPVGGGSYGGGAGFGPIDETEVAEPIGDGGSSVKPVVVGPVDGGPGLGGEETVEGVGPAGKPFGGESGLLPIDKEPVETPIGDENPIEGVLPDGKGTFGIETGDGVSVDDPAVEPIETLDRPEHIGGSAYGGGAEEDLGSSNDDIFPIVKSAVDVVGHPKGPIGDENLTGGSKSGPVDVGVEAEKPVAAVDLLASEKYDERDDPISEFEPVEGIKHAIQPIHEKQTQGGESWSTKGYKPSRGYGR